MELKWKLHIMNFKWRSDTGDRIIMDVHRGTLVKGVAIRVGEVFDAVTGITVGDTDDKTKFGTVTYGSLTLQNMIGEYLCTQQDGGPNANGKLYTDDNTVLARITVSGTPSTGEAIAYVIYAEVE